MQSEKKMEKVLFVCIHNSARSQMAESFANKYGEGKILAESAGLEPGNLNPFVVQAMKEVGIDISENETNSVFEFFEQGKVYDKVITVCDKEAAERCPVFPGLKGKLHWGFPDPSSKKGTDEEKLEFARKVRDEIEARIKDWIAAL